MLIALVAALREERKRVSQRRNASAMNAARSARRPSPEGKRTEHADEKATSPNEKPRFSL
jgi:hypothetical protein